MDICSILLTHVFVYNFLTHTTEGACRFPPELSDRDEERWRFMSPDYSVSAITVHSWRKVTLEGERLHVDYILESGKKTEVKRLTYHCIAEDGKDKFVLMYQDSYKGPMFICVRFLLRGPDVIQWKISEASGQRKPGMCEDSKLHVMDSLMVYYNEKGDINMRNGAADITVCPLPGGYVIRQYFTEDSDPGCQEDSIPPLKIENGCEEGEGLYFLGGSTSCPSPHEKVLIGRQYHCLASWTEGNYTFMMIEQSQPNGLIPCIRYPTTIGSRFTMHLFLDGVCDSGDPIHNSHIYRQMLMGMFPAMGICSDDTPACEVKDTTHCQFTLAKSCRNSCQSCPAEAAWLEYTFPPEFHGTWMKDSKHLGREEVIIDKQHIKVPSLGTYRTMGQTDCSIKQPNQAPYGLTIRAKEYSLVQTFKNGCSHRMTILQIVNRSESVLSFRVSKPGVINWLLAVNEESMKWQITEGWGKWCLKVTYPLPQVKPKDSARTDLTGWFNLLNENPDSPTVNCTLPEKIKDEFRMILPTGQECNGILVKNAPEEIELRYNDCKSSGVLQSGSRAIQQLGRFECLASFIGESKRTFLVTRSPEEHPNAANETHICWVFSAGQDFGIVYWFRVSDCDANSDVYAQRGFKQELAKFYFHFEASPTEVAVVGASIAIHYSMPTMLLLNMIMCFQQ